MIVAGALRKGRFFICSSKGGRADWTPSKAAPFQGTHLTAPNRRITGALLHKALKYIPKSKSLYRRLQGAIQHGLQNTVAFRGAIAVTDNLPVTCRATAQSKTQQKRQDRILFTTLVHDRTLIRVSFSCLYIQFFPMPGGRFLHPPGFCNSVNYRSPVLTHNFTHNAILLHFTQLFVFSKII